jgi:hypothetical protein
MLVAERDVVVACRCDICQDIERGQVGKAAPLPAYGLRELVGNRHPAPGLLSAMLALFDGHEVPALWARYGVEWHPARLASRRLAYRAHLLGVARTAAYPFRGTEPDCGCPRDAHICPGRGATYLCLDVDSHNGEIDAGAIVARLLGACYQVGLRALVFASRSATGAHLYVFFDAAVPTAEVHAAGAALRRAARAEGRVDVIPSAEHTRGYGTHHTLPLHPIDAEHGGGMLLDPWLRPVRDMAAVVAILRQAHENRSSAALIRLLVAEPGVVSPTATSSPTTCSSPIATSSRTTSSPRESPRRDRAIVKAVKAHHPQFRQAAAAEPERWRGRRSARDAALARILVRQGVSPQGVARALATVEGSKAASEGGLAYARALATWEPSQPAPLPLLPGMLIPARTPRPEAVGLLDPGDGRRGPWANRVAPPLAYDSRPNPWWLPSVQDRLRGRRSKADAPTLAFLIAYWLWGRGLHPRRRFYLGAEAAGRALGLHATAVRGAFLRLPRDFGDVLRAKPVKPHPLLRLATEFDIVGLGPSQDAFTG